MSLFFKNHFKYFNLFCFILLSNCQLADSSNNHGILFLENRSNTLIVQKSNINDVIRIIGEPHTKSINNHNEWIYIERVLSKGKYHKLGRHDLKKSNVLFLKFDKFGILNDKKFFDKNDINKINFTSKETTNDLTKKSFVEGLFTSLKAKMYGKK